MNRFALWSLYRSLTRHKLHAALNIGGLAVGIAVFLVLSLYVRFETSYEKWLPGHEQIYLVQTRIDLPGSPFSGAYSMTMGGLLEQLREDHPGVLGTRIRGGKDGGSVQRGAEAIKEDVAQVDPSFFDVFALPMLKGSGSALNDPTSALISRSTARKHFGSTDPVGQPLTVSIDWPATYRIAGVFEDLPANSELRLSILIPLPKGAPAGQWQWYMWGTASVSTFLRFDTAAQRLAFSQTLPAMIDRRATTMGPQPSRFLSLPLLPLSDIHLQPQGSESAGRKTTVVALGIVGLIALLIAIVNYVNLATARAGVRAREVAMRKVLGADRRALVGQFLSEALLTVAVAALAGLILAELSLPWVNAAGGLSLTLPYSLVVPALAAATVPIALAAGFYPALLLSRFPAAAVLASARAPGGGRAGARVREALVVLQFALSTAFVIGTAVLVAQTHHMRNADLGFQREGLLMVPSLAEIGISPPQARAILAAFRELPGVRAVGSANVGAGVDGNAALDAIDMPGLPAPGLTIRVISVGPGFFEAYAPRLLAGRLFDDAHGADDASDWQKWKLGRNIVVNLETAKRLGFASPQEAIGKTVGGAMPRTIIGVIDQLRFFSPRAPDDTTSYQYYREGPGKPVAAIRFTGDPQATLAAARQVWLRLAPQVPFVAATADRRLALFYEADDRATRLFGIGAALAVLIGCIGLWGLASFNTQRRVKEIGIRKTLGASSADIARLLVGQFLRPVLIANLLAWPLAFVAMRKWLAGFDDRIELSPLYFVGATVLAMGIAVLTVLGQSLRASRAAPSWGLRHD
ncbi:putative ABC transport system permease protein [Pelomonas aquatica]|uniref:ABC transport system permease protein n=1 Tax=Pelomonas aquatica TaxID=431058 RepID=A0ABU1Z2K2_9BURK|nr:ABC transporter permease [Pelomonas aquatica]MDR7294698.1 putative ABC transport system permease protein [Pelomonas aquatica]